MIVRLSEILDTFDEMSETTSHYLDLETGEIVCIDSAHGTFRNSRAV